MKEIGFSRADVGKTGIVLSKKVGPTLMLEIHYRASAPIMAAPNSEQLFYNTLFKSEQQIQQLERFERERSGRSSLFLPGEILRPESRMISDAENQVKAGSKLLASTAVETKDENELSSEDEGPRVAGKVPAKKRGDEQAGMFPDKDGEKTKGDLEAEFEERLKKPDASAVPQRAGVKFFALLKEKNGSGLLMECYTEDIRLTMLSIAHTQNVGRLMHRMATEQLSCEFRGPSMQTVDEQVLEGLYMYLEGIGLNDKLLGYIECTAVEKDQDLYVEWLENAKEFASISI